MTETYKDKESKKNTNQDFTPEISKLAKKRAVSLMPAIAISLGLVLLLGAFLYIFLFKDMGIDVNQIKKAISKPDIIKKEFSFKKAAGPEEVIQETKSQPNRALLPQQQAISSKPIFQKYKSIPLKSSSAEASTPFQSKTDKDQEGQKIGTDAAVVAENSPIDPHFLIAEGTYIPCSLTTKFTSEVTGRIGCTIAEDIYSANGLVKLIERGTRAIGTYQGSNLKQGVGRMFVIWTKLITPDFKHIKLVDSQVVGQLGESGIEGWIDSHFFERFGGAILLSTAKDIIKLTQEQSQKGQNGNSVSVNTMDDTKGAFVAIIEKILENSINIPPTMYKNQGDIIGILVGRDIDFSKVYTLKMNE